MFGDGPVELVFVGPFITHVEMFWAMPEFKAFFDQLATFCRVLVFDKAGVGLSDPIPKVRLLEERAAEIEAVMDAAGFGKPVLFGNSEGGPQAIAFAARRPERTRALILYGSRALVAGGSWDDLDRDPAELRARVLPEVGEKYTPSTEQIARMQEMGRAGLSAWGSGAALKVFVPSVRSVRQLAMFERMCASPGMVRATLESNLRMDVRPILPTISAPTLVIHARDDIVPVQGGRYLADHIPGARYLEVDGDAHAPWFTDPDTILTAIEEFLTGSHAAPSQSHRALRTVQPGQSGGRSSRREPGQRAVRPRRDVNRVDCGTTSRGSPRECQRSAEVTVKHQPPYIPLEPSGNTATLGGVYVRASYVLGAEAASDDDRWDELQRAEADELRDVDR